MSCSRSAPPQELQLLSPPQELQPLSPPQELQLHSPPQELQPHSPPQELQPEQQQQEQQERPTPEQQADGYAKQPEFPQLACVSKIQQERYAATTLGSHDFVVWAVGSSKYILMHNYSKKIFFCLYIVLCIQNYLPFLHPSFPPYLPTLPPSLASSPSPSLPFLFPSILNCPEPTSSLKGELLQE